MPVHAAPHSARVVCRAIACSGLCRGEALGLKCGFEPPDLDRPGMLPHQQGLCEPLRGEPEARLGYRERRLGATTSRPHTGAFVFFLTLLQALQALCDPLTRVCVCTTG